ncbi:MAG: glycine--tRNA ligase subunit beta [Candidatus Cloacimonadaceae bacterium]
MELKRKLEKRDFLLEIGMEELPPSHFMPARDWLQASFEAFIGENRLSCDKLLVSGTPRRFFVLAEGVPILQPDIVLERTGPSVNIAYKDGELTPAALGFLKKNNATAADVQVQSTPRGDFIHLSIKQPGKEAQELLKDWSQSLLEAIPFAKKMIWEYKDLSFSRPVRWLCALFGDEVLQLKNHGIPCGRISYANRHLGLDKSFEIPQPSAYLEVLKANRVMADRDERLKTIQQSLIDVFEDRPLQVMQDDRLAEIVCDLVEWPTAVEACFDEAYLVLPEKIITSTISQNQRYFSVLDTQGNFTNRFVFISNGDPQKSEIIRQGNEKVVNARLADAQWYFNEDSSRPLESYVPALEEVVFQADLGTMAAKVKRIEALCAWICEELKLPEAEVEKVLRCAYLAKADLVTTMLGEKEFTKLQGYIGMQYAMISGEDSEVATGIWEHYAPRGPNDALPETLCGAVVSVADKLDTVCGIIRAGLLPTGSADPFALRRAANGVCQILLKRGWHLPLEDLIAKSQAILEADIAADKELDEKAANFFVQRVQWLFKQEGIAFDVLDSLEHLQLAAPIQLMEAALALSKIRETEDFHSLIIGFKRAANILEGSADSTYSLDTKLFVQEEERALYESLKELRVKLDDALKTDAYEPALKELVQIGPAIDRFFDEVLVNCEDEALRHNRHALLNEIKSEFLKVADISKLVIDNIEENK